MAPALDSTTLAPEDEEAAKAEKEAALAERREAIREWVRDYAFETFNTMGAASERQTRELLTGLDYIELKESDVSGWENMVNVILPAQMESAKNLYWNRLMNPLLDLYNAKAIDRDTIQRWDQRFRDPMVDYKSKENFILRILPEYMKNWRKVAENRQKVMEKAKKEGVNLADTPPLHKLMNEEAFLKLDYQERADLVAKASSMMTAKEVNLEPKWNKARALLKPLTIGPERCLHPNKIGRWLERMMTHCHNAKEADQFIEDTLLPYIENWRSARAEYDSLHAIGIPRGFHAASELKFLGWEFEKRQSYLEELRRSQETADEFAETALAQEKRAIRHDVSIKDWEGAEERLGPALEEHPEDPDLQSLERYIRSHKPKQGEKEEGKEEMDLLTKPQQHLDTIHQLLRQAPPQLARIYRMALFKGAKTLRRTNQLLYNRIWVRERGYTNDKDEFMHANSNHNKEKTKQYVDDGHTHDFERNVIDGETAKEEAVRDECRSPQALYVSSENFEPVMQKIHDNAGNENFGYWTTAFLTDVDYDAQASSVKNLQRPILNELRALEKYGYQYTDLSTLTLKESDARKMSIYSAENSQN